MSKDVIEAATVRPPRRGECHALAGTASTQVFAVPSDWFGKKVRFEAVGDNFYVQSGPDVSISIDTTARSTITSNVLSAAPSGAAEPVLAGSYKEFDFFYGVDAYVGVRGTGTSGVLLFRMAEVALGNV
jgi:hypothetical protein